MKYPASVVREQSIDGIESIRSNCGLLTIATLTCLYEFDADFDRFDADRKLIDLDQIDDLEGYLFDFENFMTFNLQ